MILLSISILVLAVAVALLPFTLSTVIITVRVSQQGMLLRKKRAAVDQLDGIKREGDGQNPTKYRRARDSVKQL